jgi:tRNA (Thr-GGU) A37 N-methylase
MRAVPVPLEREVVELRVRLPVIAGTHGLERVEKVTMIIWWCHKEANAIVTPSKTRQKNVIYLGLVHP